MKFPNPITPTRVFHAILIPLIAIAGESSAQIPFISSTDKIKGKAQEQVSITGINFGMSSSNIKVSFGGVSVTPTSISDQLINVKVPLGASYDFIKVLNTSNGLSGASEDYFLPSFGGENPFDETRLGSQMNFDSESGLYDVAVADFDGDDKLDVATANNNSNMLSIFRNTGSVGTFSFVKTTLNPAAKTIQVSTGDLNGDNKPDVIASESNGPRVFIFKNTSTIGSISFVMQTVTLVGGSWAKQSRVEDLDLDGKPELIVSDQAVSRIHILKNQSSVSTISFAAPQLLNLPTSNTITGTDGIGIGDLNGDHFPDLVIGEFLRAPSIIYILKNNSTPGTISLASVSQINQTNLVSNIAIGDLDGDNKADVAVTFLNIASVFVFKNQSTDPQISLADPEIFGVGEKPWGIELGDVDGDGKIDIAVASISQKSLTVLNNQSSSGSFSFTAKTISTTYINRIVKLQDMDLDGRPDFVFTSIDDNVLGVPASKVSVFRNINCVLPTITPAGPITVCNTNTQRLESSINANATYEWFKDGVSQGAPGTNSFFDVTQTGLYTIRMVEGSCSKTSTGVQVNVVTSAPLGSATIDPVTPVCLNGTLNLSVSNVGATQYAWTGPVGFVASGLSVSRPNFDSSMAGEYFVDIISGTCVTEHLSIIVDVVSIPNLSIQFSGPDIICAGDSKQLSAYPAVTGYDYQWAEQVSGNISGATTPNHTINTSGKYIVKLTSQANPSCPSVDSPPTKIRVAQVPLVNFSTPATNCTGQEIQFTDQSTVDIDPEDTEVKYDWDFGDATNSTDQNPIHTFANAQSYNVSLTVSYRENACPGSTSKSITIVSPPAVQITNPDNRYAVCENDSLKLEVLGSFTDYLWDGGETESFIYAKEAGEYSVTVTGGCTISVSRNISSFNAPNVSVTANPLSVNLGESTTLQGQGLSEYHWKPNINMTDSLNFSTEATPAENTEYTVYGFDQNGCYGSASIEITVVPEDALSLLKPSIFFSPNGDDINPFWEVENMPVLRQCGVSIYDERGFKIYDAKPYDNDWDGYSQKGQKLAAGVYFYIIKCDDSSRILTGSINLIR